MKYISQCVLIPREVDVQCNIVTVQTPLQYEWCKGRFTSLFSAEKGISGSSGNSSLYRLAMQFVRGLCFLAMIATSLTQTCLSAPVSEKQVRNAVQVAVAKRYPANRNGLLQTQSMLGASRRAVKAVEAVTHDEQLVGYVVSL